MYQNDLNFICIWQLRSFYHQIICYVSITKNNEKFQHAIIFGVKILIGCIHDAWKSETIYFISTLIFQVINSLVFKLTSFKLKSRVFFEQNDIKCS